MRRQTIESKLLPFGLVSVLTTVILTGCASIATPTEEADSKMKIAEGGISARGAALSYIFRSYGVQVFPAPGLD